MERVLWIAHAKNKTKNANTGANTDTFEGATTLKLVILEHLSKLKPYMNETHHGSGVLYSTTITSFTSRVG
jgi:hypothetical protein